MSVYIGDRLGLYAALSEVHRSTSTQLAARTRMDERYVREWLEQQAATGLLDVREVDAPAEAREYSLPAGHRQVLLDPTSLSYMAAAANVAVGALTPLPKLLEAFRTGAGIPFSDYGSDMREGIAASNRPLFVNLLASEWLPSLPDIHSRLQTHPLR